ncbi:MAG: MFS transporter [Candidatus Saccharimonadia bacterium]
MEVLDLRNPQAGSEAVENRTRRALDGPRPSAARLHTAVMAQPMPIHTEAPQYAHEIQNPSAPSVTAKTASAVKEQGFVRKWASLLVLSLALAIIIIDTTLLNVSLRSIIIDLHTTIQGLQWVITAYSLTLAALTITGGRLGDLFGRKKMFVLGAIIFAVGSFISSISHSLGVLITGEAIIEGIGAAMMMPATASLLIANFRGRERAIAFGVWGSVAGAASAIGPILGGYLTTHYSWRWGFRINVFIAAILVIGSLIVRESFDDQEKPQLDVVGIFLSAIGLLSVVFGIIESSTYGWFSPKLAYAIFGHSLPSKLSITVLSTAIGLFFIGLFLLWENYRESQDKTPLVSLELFEIRQFTSGVFVMALLSLSMVGLIFVLPVFLQSVKGLDALHTGLALLPLSIAILIMGPLSGFLSSKIPPKYLIQLGLLFNITAVIVLHSALQVNATWQTLAPALALFGIGMGLVMAQISNMTLSAVSVSQAGEASGVNNTLRQVGSSMGSAILGAVLISAITANVATGIKNSTIIPQSAKPAISAEVSANASNVAFGAPSTSRQVLPADITSELDRISKSATTAATQKTVLYGIPFTILAFFMSLLLPGKTDIETSKSAAHVSGH